MTVIPKGLDRGGRFLHAQPSPASFLPCSAAQRSAQELPQVEAYSPSACSVRGGEELVLTGSNFLPDSKVVFIERGPGEYLPGPESVGRKIMGLAGGRSLVL